MPAWRGFRIFDRLAQHRHEPGLAGPVWPQQHDPVALADELLAGPEQQSAVRRRDGGIVQRNQNLGMRSAIGKLDRPCGSLQVGGLCRIFQLLGPLLQLLGLLQQKIAAGIDADIVELCRVLAKLLGSLQVASIAPLVRCIQPRGVRRAPAYRATKISATAPAAGIACGSWSRRERRGRGWISRRACPAAARSASFQAGRSWRGPDGWSARRATTRRPRPPDAGKHGKPLPAAAQLLQRPLPQCLGHLKRFQGDIDPPAFACAAVQRKASRAPPHRTAVSSRTSDGTSCST